MPNLSELRVPIRHVPIHRFLATAAEEQYAALRAGVANAGPLSSSEKFIRRVQEALPDLPVSDARVLIAVLFTLHSMRNTHDWSYADMAAAISSSPELELATEEDRARLQERLLDLLGIRSVQILAKASDVVAEHAHLFHTARFLTDVRPVFTDDADLTPSGAVITQTLKIEYFGNDGRIDAFYVALSESDLRLVGQAVERATKKAITLGQLLDSAGLTTLNMREDAE